MNAPAKKLSDLGKQWSAAPGWQERRIVAGDVQRGGIEKPAEPGEEFRRQYDIWRSEHPAHAAARDYLPPLERPDFDVKRAVRIGAIAGGAALAAFYLTGVVPNLSGGGFQPAEIPQAPVAKPIKAARLDVPPMPVAVKFAEAPAWPETLKQADIVVPKAEEPAIQQSAPMKQVPSLSPEEIGLMLKRGEEFIATGDLASARLVLERAARAHDSRAAFALASTYDPAVLEAMQVYGAAGDLELAIMWYERAKQYGSRDAGPRLLALAARN